MGLFDLRLIDMRGLRLVQDTLRRVARFPLWTGSHPISTWRLPGDDKKGKPLTERFADYDALSSVNAEDHSACVDVIARDTSRRARDAIAQYFRCVVLSLRSHP